MPGRRRAATLRAFLETEAAGGLILIGAAALALVVANVPATAGGYRWLLHAPLGPLAVEAWINDGLMALFFLLVGLEIKRELSGGELATAERRRLPFIAAFAGMAVPALVYLAIVGGDRSLQAGWAIPAATDIAFAVGVLALLGSRVPPALKLLLTAVAIVDDMGAVAIIAVAYTDGIRVGALAGACAVAAALYVVNRRGVAALWPYLAGFALLWVLLLVSGVHATIAGVVTAALVPTRAGDGEASPLDRLEHGLAPWVGFVVVPLFGFANAGVAIGAGTIALLREPLVLGIAAGLFLGKQVGIFGGIRAACALGIARLPAGTRWVQIYGLALIAGIGFTMSLFIGGLAFADAGMRDAVKVGVLAGSLLSAACGSAVLLLSARRP